MHRDYLYWIWLSLRFGPGVGGFTEVLEKFNGPYGAYISSESELEAAFGLRSPLVSKLMDKNLEEAHRIYDFCASRGVSLLTYGDIAYPARLKTIQNPPLLLYYVGKLPALNRKLCIGVVGTRKMSEYGKRMAYKISYELASADAVVVSGMALGCDAVAAAGAIGAGGSTVAVLGSGIDVIYPRQHLKLMEEIKKYGAVMTEYPPGTPPCGRNFPVRNRIISGLSQGTLAVEGDLHSGALLTVGHAVKQGRKVFVVPGNVGESNSEGTNELIRKGATVVLDGGDVLASFEVTDKELIDHEGFLRAKSRSDLNESVLFRLGISSRLSESDVSERGADVPDLSDMGGKKPRLEDLIAKRQTETDPKTKKTEKKKPSRKKNESEKPEEQPGGQQTEKQPEKTVSGDGSDEVLASLSDRDRTIFCEMPIDRAISIDRLGALGYSIGDIMTALTILEIRGLVTSLPGGLYMRK